MSAMLFRRTIYLLALLGALLAQLFDVGYLAHYLFVLTLSLPLAGLALSLPAMLGCRPRLLPRHPQVQRGGRAAWLLILDNRFPLPLARASCRFQIQCATTGKSRKLRKAEEGVFPGLALPLRLSTQHCGRLECRVRRIWVCDCLGLFALPVRPPHPAAVLVEPVPAQTDLPPVPAQKALPVPRGFARAGEDYELRDYRPGDSVRAIHWKLSAKQDQLIVREPLAGQQPLPVLIFDHLGPPEALDEKAFRRSEAMILGPSGEWPYPPLRGGGYPRLAALPGRHSFRPRSGPGLLPAGAAGRSRRGGAHRPRLSAPGGGSPWKSVTAAGSPSFSPPL